MSKIDSDVFPDVIANMSDSERHRWVKAIVRRMMQAWRVGGQKALSAKLGFHSNTVSNWIQNRSVPWTTVYNCHIQTGVSMDWLVTGQEKPHGAMSAMAVTTRFEKELEVFWGRIVDMELIPSKMPHQEALKKGMLAVLTRALTGAVADE